jgi:hypothetical protein
MLKKATYLLIVVSLIALLCLSYAYFIEPDYLTVKEYQLNISTWKKEASNLKIVAISDVHGGSNFIDEAKIRQIVELTNQQNADLVVLLGDYVSQQRVDRSKLKMPIETIAENLKGIKAKLGVFAVLGNHDGWYDDKHIQLELEKVGYKVLENEAVTLNHNGEKIRLLGMADALKVQSWNTYIAKGKNALSQIDKEGNLIIVTHSPEVFPLLSELDAEFAKDVDLYIAGHTHGGQVRFPFIGSLVVPTSHKQRYVSGIVIEKEKHFFITQGIGTSILPIRFNVPPEISVLNINLQD